MAVDDSQIMRAESADTVEVRSRSPTLMSKERLGSVVDLSRHDSG